MCVYVCLVWQSLDTVILGDPAGPISIPTSPSYLEELYKSARIEEILKSTCLCLSNTQTHTDGGMNV